MTFYNNVIAGAAGAGGGGDAYTIQHSLRFNPDDSAHLSKSFSTDSTTFSVSFWFKRSAIVPGNVYQHIFNSNSGSGFGITTYQDYIYLYNNAHPYTTGRLLRDPNAWYHIFVSANNGSASLYVNNELVQTVTGASYGSTARIGGWNAGSYFIDGYLADIYLVDGLALAATDFGEYDNNNVWQPKEVSSSHLAAAVDYGTGAQPLYNLDNSFSTKASPATFRTDSNASNLQIAVAGDNSDEVSHSIRGSGSALTLTTSGVTFNQTGKFYSDAFLIQSAGSHCSVAETAAAKPGTSDFCVEFWINPTTTPGNSGLFSYGDYNTAGSFGIMTTGSNSLRVDMHDGNSQTGSALTVANGLQTGWQHFALTRSGTTCTLYRNGISQGTWTIDSSADFTPTGYPYFVIGNRLGLNFGSYNITSYFQDFRVYVGTSKYTGDFTPPSAYGTNTFHLDFSDTSSHAAIGNDANGANNWTAVNLSTSVTSVTPPKCYQADALYTNVADIVANGTLIGTNGVGGASVSNKYCYIVHNDFGIIGTTVFSAGWSNSFAGHRYDPSTNTWTNTGGYNASSASEWQNWVYEDDGTESSYELDKNWGTGFTFAAARDSNSQPARYTGTYPTLNTANFNTLATVQAAADVSRDSPTIYEAESGNNGGNYATLSPIDSYMSSGSINSLLKDGNLTKTNVASTYGKVRATMPVHFGGKTYFEVTCSGTPDNNDYLGFEPSDMLLNSSGGFSSGVLGFRQNGTLNPGSTSYGASWSSGDVIGFYFDYPNQVVGYYLNGVDQGTAYSSFDDSKYYMPAVQDWSNAVSGSFTFNFGQRPFKYSNAGVNRPSNEFKPLGTAYFDEPLIADGSVQFQTKLITGNNSTQPITTTGMTPDLVWLKRRNNGTYSHSLVDTVRGAGQRLAPEGPYDEDTFAAVSTFDSQGFTLGNTVLNETGATTVAWAWEGGDLFANSVYHQSQVWSDLVTGTLETTYGNPSAAAPFDGDTGSNYSDGIRPTAGNYLSMNFGTTFANATSVKIFGHASLDGVTYAGANENLKINGTAIGSSDWADNGGGSGQSSATFTLSSGLTTLEWGYSSGSQSTGYLYLQGIEVDGKLLVDAGFIPVGSLNSSIYLQGDVYSGDLSTNDSLSNVTYAFDGNVSTRAQTANGGANKTLTWAPSPAVSFTQLFEVYCDQGSNVPTATWNGNSVSPGAGKWVTVYAGSGTIDSTTPLVINTNAAAQYATLKAVRLDGKILVDSNITLADVPGVATTCRANPTAGMSIVTYTGNLNGAGNSTIAHGLNTAPSLIITKDRDNSTPWIVQHESLGTNEYLQLNLNNTPANSSGAGAGTLPKPTSNVFYGSWLSGLNTLSNDHVAFCFAPVKNYSAFGTYEGNQNPANGASVIWTGFTPAFIIVKYIDSAGQWYIYDDKRSPTNVAYQALQASQTDQENTDIANFKIDILSSGFKMRQTNGPNNNGTYVWAAFASTPFQYARAR